MSDLSKDDHERGRGRLLLMILVLVSGAVAFEAGTAHADEPAVQGWWSAANPGDVAPANPASVSDVPADGLLLQAGPAGPTAYAALGYYLEPGSAATTLTLTVAPSTVSTPGGTIDVCPLKDAGFSPSQAGPLANAPAYDCAKKVVATASADGTTYTAQVGALQQGDSLAVALLPGAATARVVLARPGATSLTTAQGLASVPVLPVESGAGTDPGAPGEPGGTGTAAAPGLGVGGAVVPSTGLPTAPDPESQGPVVAPDGSSGPVAASTGATPQAVAAEVSDTAPRLALGLLLGFGALGAVLWAFAGMSGGLAPRLEVPSRPAGSEEGHAGTA